MWGSYGAPQSIRVKIQMVAIPMTSDIRLVPRVYSVTDQCTPIQLHEGLVHPAEPGSGTRSNDHHTDAPRRLRFHSKISHHIPHQVL
jgi:hypothetical protein